MPMSLKDEIYEQPRAIADLLASQAETVRSVARCVRDRNIRWVFLAARGTSDNAGLYAKYLWGAHNRLPVALAAPSLFSVYKTPPAVDDALVVAISQSGQSPDILGVVAEGRRQGALTLAITNDVGSPLAEEAQLVIDTTAGPETAVAATKTFTTQLVAIAMLSAALTEESEHQEWLARLPQLVEDALSLDDFIMPAVERYRYMSQCAVLGRGFNYATAFEWSLKLKELAYVVAEPYSPADFQHGPMALAHDGFPVLAVVLKGGDSENIIALLTSLVEKRKVELVAISNEATALNLANTPLELPEGLPEWVTPIPAIVPAQLFCYHLTRAKGFDTEDPRGLSKVTLTW
jgi:glucosamine--fructose-6-phosphate aminotransferase (isomerizing)